MSASLPISILELAIIAEDSNATTTLERTKLLAQTADKLEYKRFWLAEHHNMAHVASSATVVLIGHIASQTQNIRVGSGGIMLPNHAPLIVAEQFGTLATLYPNRIDLGLGRAPGTDGLTAQAIRKDFVEQSQRFPENVTALQDFFNVNNASAKVRAFPAEGVSVPIWILGSSLESAALAASKGLPYAFAGHFAPKLMHQAFQYYRDHFEPSAYLQEPKMMACVNAVAADTDEEAAKLATSLTQMFLNLIRNDRKPLQPPVEDINDLMSEVEKFHVDQMTACSFVGSTEKIARELQEFVKYTQIDELMITSPIYDFDAKTKSMHLMKTVAESIVTSKKENLVL